jgi:hypothetical protein
VDYSDNGIGHGSVNDEAFLKNVKKTRKNGLSRTTQRGHNLQHTGIPRVKLCGAT